MAGNGKTLEHVCFLLKRDRMFLRDHQMLILYCRIELRGQLTLIVGHVEEALGW